MTKAAAIKRIEAFVGPDDGDTSTVRVFGCPSCKEYRATELAVIFHRMHEHRYKPPKTIFGTWTIHAPRESESGAIIWSR